MEQLLVLLGSFHVSLCRVPLEASFYLLSSCTFYEDDKEQKFLYHGIHICFAFFSINLHAYSFGFRVSSHDSQVLDSYIFQQFSSIELVTSFIYT